MKNFRDFLEQSGVDRLVIYDFDGTIFRSPEPVDGASRYKAITGSDWPFKGWWGRDESLSPPLVPEKPDDSWFIPRVTRSFRKDFADPKTKVVLMTGRPFKLRRRIVEILSGHGMDFDDYFFAGSPGTSGSNTLEIKTNNLQRLVSPQIKTLEIWEDRPEHIVGFHAFSSVLKDKNPGLEVFIHNAQDT
jgi:hypothetical protein